MEILKIEWMPYAKPGRQWWVYVYAANDDGSELSGSNIATQRMIGQFESVAAALTEYPEARLSEKSKRQLAADPG